MYIFLLIFIFIIGWAVTNYFTYIIARKEYREILKTVDSLKLSLTDEKTKYSKLLNQKKSSEVRTGKILEKMAPFLSDFPHDPQNCFFWGGPVDYIVINEDSIEFLEVKSGNATLTNSQKNIKRLIEEGKVFFNIYKIKGD